METDTLGKINKVFSDLQFLEIQPTGKNLEILLNANRLLQDIYAETGGLIEKIKAAEEAKKEKAEAAEKTAEDPGDLFGEKQSKG
jgi:hypothetical protein